MRRPLPDDGVDLWLADPAVCRRAPLRSAYEALLNDAERAQQRRFLFEADRDRHLLTRALVRTVLAGYTGAAPESLVFDTNAWGKPSLRQPPGAQGPLAFNVSHTGGLVALAVSAVQPLGIDVEDTRRAAPMRVAERFFSAPERAALFALPPALRAQRFWALWTLKESYVKALGTGLHQPLDSFGFDLDIAPERRVIGFTGPAGMPPCRWWFGTWQASVEHVLSLGLAWDRPEPPRLRSQRITPLRAAAKCTLVPLRATDAPVVMG